MRITLQLHEQNLCHCIIAEAQEITGNHPLDISGKRDAWKSNCLQSLKPG